MVHMLGTLTSRTGEVLVKMWKVRVEPGKRVLQRHSHTQFEIMLVNSGSGSYTTTAGVKTMEPGDMFVFASNEFHCITEVGKDGLEITNLHFEPRYLLSDGEGLSQANQNFCFAHAKTFDNRIPGENCNMLRELFLQIRQELTGKKQEYPVSVRALLNLLAVRLIRDHGYAAEQSGGVPQLSGILKAMSYIDAHLAELLTLQEISAAAGISPNYFSTLFKRMCHVTLWDYITAKRIEKAIGLISSDSGMTMLEIALNCGFNNTANFNKAFRKQTGMTPSCFRNSEDPFLH